jgi:uncharacterized protein
MRRGALLFLALMFFAGGAQAQPAEPEYFRITGVKEDDNVNMRRQPNVDSRIVGKIPKDADGIKNLGCKGFLTPKQFEKASPAWKKASARSGWCEVEYNNVTGWVSRRFLAEGTSPKKETPPAPVQPAPPPVATAPAPAITPSFDCEKAEKNAEKLVCKDTELAALDREVARLYALASDALNATPGFEDLLDGQRKWLAQRNTCFDRECVAEMYVRRVHQLRRSHAETRADNPKSISVGPLTAQCEGLQAPISLSLINSEPGFAYLEWPGGFVVLPHVKSGSGARYETTFASLHTKGDEALVKLPAGERELNCKIEKRG